METKENEQKIENKPEDKTDNQTNSNKEEKENKEDLTGNLIINQEKEKSEQKKLEENNTNKEEDEKIDPHLIFHKELLNVIKTQERILNLTSTVNEKFDVSNAITKEQIDSFKTNVDKYGNYLLMIKKELGLISETMRKIKKLAKENNKSS